MTNASKTTFGLLALAAAMAAGSAAAAPINWDYTVSSAFVTTSGATTFNSNPDGCTSVGSSLISWGSCDSTDLGAGRSGVGISNTPRTGTLVSNGPAQNANTYTHTNNVVGGTNATLTSATIEATLGLKAAGSGGPYTYKTATYQILFAETSNAAGTCAAASPPNNPCNDIWVLDGSLNNTITFDGNEYFFSFFAAPALNALPDPVCAAALAPDGCIGFTTIEGQVNAVNFMLRVTSRPLVAEVPEPASIALLGVGLLGLAGLRRRQHKA